MPGGLKNNREFAACAVETLRELPREIEDLLYDPQTSGGLLIALPVKRRTRGATRRRVPHRPRAERGRRKPIRLI